MPGMPARPSLVGGPFVFVFWGGLSFPQKKIVKRFSAFCKLGPLLEVLQGANMIAGDKCDTPAACSPLADKNRTPRRSDVYKKEIAELRQQLDRERAYKCAKRIIS
jgi:hypothetical protein